MVEIARRVSATLELVSLLNRFSSNVALRESSLDAQLLLLLLLLLTGGSPDDIDFPAAARRESRSSISSSPTRKKYPAREALRFHLL